MAKDLSEERLQIGTGEEWLAIGRGGWVLWHVPGWHAVRVRFAPGVGGQRLVVTGLLLEAYQEEGKRAAPTLSASEMPVISATDLRTLALGRIESIVNTPRNAATLRQRLGGTNGADYSPSRCSLRQAYQGATTLPLRPESQSLELPVPPGRSHSIDFFTGVAEVYSRALAAGLHPVGAIATVNGVPEGTVNRWLREARRAGVLAPARRKSN